MAGVRVKAQKFDFTNVSSERTGFNPRLVEEGDYAGKIVSLVEQLTKEKPDGGGGDPMWVIGVQLVDMASAVYPYYIPLTDNQLWKVASVSKACGQVVDGRAASIDPNKWVGKLIGVTLITDTPTDPQYKPKSVIDGIMSHKALLAQSDDDDSQSDDEDDDEPAPKPPARRRAAKPAPAPEPEDDDDDEYEDDEPEPTPPKRTRRRAAPAAVVEDDDDDDEVEAPPARTRRAAAKPAAKAPAKRRRAPVVEDDDDDMEIEDI